MKTISSGSKRFGSPIWEFFFQLTVISPSSTSWSLFCMLAGRILNLSHPIMLMLYGTSYTRYSDFAAYLSFTSYFTSESGLFAFAYILFVLIQLLVLGLLLQFLYLRDRLHAHHHLNERSFSCEFLHASFVFCAKVMPHICVSTLGLCVAGLVEAPGTVFSEYKHIMSPPNVSTQLYSCVTLLTVSSVEVLCIGTCFLVFCQDRSVLGNSFWSAETWYHPVAELLFVGLIETDFDSAMSPELSYILRAIGRLLCLIIFLGYTKYWKFWVDLGEFFFATLEIEITVFILAFTMLGWGFESYVSYPLLMICLSGLLCLIRAHTVWNPWLEPAKNEAEAVGSIRTVVTLARNRDSLATLSGLLLIHSQRCRNAECDCKKLISEFRKASSQGPLLGIHATMKQCEVVYFCADQVPQGIKEGAVMRAMQILVDDASSNAVRGEDLSMAQGEVAFYFVANFYAALQRIGQIELAKPRLLMKQRTYNLRRAISMGFDRAALETEDPEKTLSSLEYLKHYHKFLDQVEEATEATIKFWSIVMEDAPSSNKLNDLGKSLFKCKYKSTKTVEKISSLASNHMEFLVRYGLFMRLVMHDMITSEQIYQKLLFMSSNEGNGSRLDRNSSAFSLFRTDVSVMVIIAHMESSGAGSVCEMNTAVEQTLGYPRQDLMGASIANIMPQPVAQMHDEVVRRFFQTMKSSAINVPRAMFVKTKEGFYILCRTLMKIVPKLGRKLEVAMFLVPDRKVAYYTTDRLAPAGKKTGFVLCDPKHHGIYGFNRDGLTIIGISEDRMREFIGNATICDIFPWMGKKEFVEKLLDKEGRVVSFQSSQVMGALVNEGAAGADNTKIHRTGGNRSTDTTLLWIRLVAEQTTDSTELLASFIFSEIPKESRKNYVPDEDDPSGVFYCDPRMKSMTLRAATLASRDNRSLGTMSKARLPQHEEKKRAAPVIDFSDVASVASMASCDSTGTRTDSAGFYEATHELQIASITKQTPPAIKRFGVTMFGMLVVVVVLICVSTYVSIQEVGALKSRFGLIKEYHLRYKEIQMLTDSTRIYYPDYVLANVVDPVNGILDTRITTLTAFNVNTRKLLFSQKLEYDSEIVGITDISDTELTGTFSYAIILADLAPCMLNMTASVCQDLLRGMRYAYELGFYSLREKQDDVSKRLENEITKLSRQGESTQYMIIGICIGLIAISVGAAIPIFMWVIKDKSNALAIFADIRQEEARKIIEDSRQLDIKNLHYKRKWIQGAGESNESFWHKITTEHRRGFGRDQSDLDFVPRPRSKDKKKHQHNDNEKTIQEIKEEVPEEEEDEEKRCELEEAERKLELEEEEKKRKRHEKLSEIDYPLRRKFIVRVLGVFLLFFGYSGFALYFNNYVHNKNAEASELLFALCKRTLYVFNMNFLLVEGMLTNSTLMVGNNPYADGKLYMMDIVDEMLRIDALVKDFQKSGSRLIYGDYLDLMDQAEGPAFCNVSDVYSDIPISIYTTCWGIYSGPINNGLSAGLAYYMNQHITAAQDFLSMNMSAPNATITISTVSTALMNLGPPLTFALSFVLHGTMTVFYDCANRFFDTVGTIVYSTSSVFVGIFVVIYVLIFSRFIVTLNEEIWHTHEMVNMIPKDILEKNIVVRELVWKRRL